jgi:pyruvate formate lyase activating enzyme
MLERVLPLVDWVAMDLKSRLEEAHEGITGVRGSGARARQSMGILLASGVACRFHTVGASGQDVVRP